MLHSSNKRSLLPRHPHARNSVAHSCKQVEEQTATHKHPDESRTPMGPATSLGFSGIDPAATTRAHRAPNCTDDSSLSKRAAKERKPFQARNYSPISDAPYLTNVRATPMVPGRADHYIQSQAMLHFTIVGTGRQKVNAFANVPAVPPRPQTEGRRAPAPAAFRWHRINATLGIPSHAKAGAPQHTPPLTIIGDSYLA